MGTSVIPCHTFPQKGQDGVGIVPGNGAHSSFCRLLWGLDQRVGHVRPRSLIPHILAPLFLSFGTFLWQGSSGGSRHHDPRPIALTLWATSASLDHPCGSYRSAAQEGR